MSDTRLYPLIELGEVLKLDTEYVQNLEPRIYPKLSVKLYGRGVVLDQPTDGATVRMKRHQLAKEGQVILSEIWAKKGAIGIVPKEGAGALTTSHFFLFDIQESKLHPGYMKWLLKANYFGDSLSFEARGTTGYAAIRPKQFLMMEIPLPPLAEQRRIVGRIEALVGKVEEARRLRAAAAGEAKRLTYSALTAVFENQVSNPDWKLRPLNSVAKVARGKFAHRPRNEPRFYGGDIPFIQIGDISNSNRYIRDFTQTLNEEGLAISRMFPEGTIVIAITGATIGVTGILTFESCFPDSIVGIIADQQELIIEFAYWALEYHKSIALAQATQTTQPNINLQALSKISIPVPPLQEQKEIVQYLEGMQDRLDKLQKLQISTQQELDALLPSILDKAFKGEL